ncbi:MAG: hypothetical protein WCG75_01210 [Armatimonadota bacterium]
MKVKRMHFVCHSFANFRERDDGKFSSGFWDVSFDAAGSVETIYLHESRSTPAYWVGKVLEFHPAEWNGGQRVVFICEKSEAIGQSWEGGATGEKGYGY